MEGKGWEYVRLVLLSHNFAFNTDVAFIRKTKPKSEQEELIKHLANSLKLPEPFVYAYVTSKKLIVDDIAAHESLFYVYDKADAKGTRQVIDQEGVYIKFDPTKTNPYYNRLIKQLRAIFAYMQASEEEQERFIDTKKSVRHFLDDKNAKTPRKSHGYNLEQDIKVYLTCEKTIKDMFAVKLDETQYIEEDIKATYLYHAIEEAASKLKIEPKKAKSFYYEVCRRYKLPTLLSNPY